MSQLAGFICTQFTPTGIENIGYRFYISKLLPFPCLEWYLTEWLSLRCFQSHLSLRCLLPLSRDGLPNARRSGCLL